MPHIYCLALWMAGSRRVHGIGYICILAEAVSFVTPLAVESSFPILTDPSRT